MKAGSAAFAFMLHAVQAKSFLIIAYNKIMSPLIQSKVAFIAEIDLIISN